MSRIKATWIIGLKCHCPACKRRIDVAGNHEIYHTIDPCEHDTERSKGVEVSCPRCNHEFKVDCEY